MLHRGPHKLLQVAATDHGVTPAQVYSTCVVVHVRRPADESLHRQLQKFKTEQAQQCTARQLHSLSTSNVLHGLVQPCMHEGLTNAWTTV
eukprot:365444-Chlamydomonas_euryale.AAC.8